MSDMRTSCRNLPGSLFHEYWWLEAATAGRFLEVRVRHGDHLAGRLPFCVVKRNGLRHLCMPDFTHVLGPLVNSGDGKQQTRMMNRLSTVESLIKRLPPFDSFNIVTDASLDDGLTAVDGLAFQSHGFRVGYQFTFHLDCRADLKILQAGMESRVRQNIRRAEERFAVETVDDPHRFISFYLDNLRKANRNSYCHLISLLFFFRNAGLETVVSYWPQCSPAALPPP